MHERIRRFSLDGVVSESSKRERVQDEVRKIVENQMRDEGYAPHLDCGMHWSVDYFPDSNNFGFKISLYGVFVGKERADTGAVYYAERVHEI